MKHGIALIVIVAMIVSGCAAARGAVTTRPLAAAHADPAIGAFVRSLPPGSRVRVETSTGRSIRGTLLQATDDVVAIERHTRIPEPPVRVGMNEVTRVTVDAPSGGGARAMVIGAAIGAGAAVGLLWLIAIFAINDVTRTAV